MRGRPRRRLPLQHGFHRRHRRLPRAHHRPTVQLPVLRRSRQVSRRWLPRRFRLWLRARVRRSHPALFPRRAPRRARVSAPLWVRRPIPPRRRRCLHQVCQPHRPLVNLQSGLRRARQQFRRPFRQPPQLRAQLSGQPPPRRPIHRRTRRLFQPTHQPRPRPRRPHLTRVQRPRLLRRHPLRLAQLVHRHRSLLFRALASLSSAMVRILTWLRRAAVHRPLPRGPWRLSVSVSDTVFSISTASASPPRSRSACLRTRLPHRRCVNPTRAAPGSWSASQTRAWDRAGATPTFPTCPSRFRQRALQRTSLLQRHQTCRQ